MKKYFLGGLGFFAAEMLLYQISFDLMIVWYSKVNRISDYPNFCKVRDAVGNCLDYPLHGFFFDLGIYGIKLVVLAVFFILLFKQKKYGNALWLVAGYVVPMACFHLGLIRIGAIDKLYTWFEVGNILGLFFVASLAVVCVSAVGIFKMRERFQRR